MHVQLGGNLVNALVNATVDGPYVVLPSSMKADVYPDDSVVRGQAELVDDGTDVISNPTAVTVERTVVLIEKWRGTPGAADLRDRGEEFRGYRAVPDMTVDLLVAEHRVRVEYDKRGRDDTWVLHEHRTGSRERLASVGGEPPIDETYRKVSSLDQLPVNVSTRSAG